MLKCPGVVCNNRMMEGTCYAAGGGTHLGSGGRLIRIPVGKFEGIQQVRVRAREQELECT